MEEERTEWREEGIVGFDPPYFLSPRRVVV